MANLITGLTSGGGGLSTTADASGQIALQTNNGTTALTLDNSQNATFAGTVTATSFSGSGSGLTGVGSITTLASNVSIGTGTSFTVSSLTLTSYKFLGISLVGVAGGATSNFISTAGTPSTSNAIFLVGASSSRWQYGILDLTAQTALGTGGGMSQATGVTTASTSITFTCNNAFTAGTYYLYGMK